MPPSGPLPPSRPHLGLVGDAPTLGAVDPVIRHRPAVPLQLAAAPVVGEAVAGVEQRAALLQRRRARRAAGRRGHAAVLGAAEFGVAVARGDVVVAYAGAPVCVACCRFAEGLSFQGASACAALQRASQLLAPSFRRRRPVHLPPSVTHYPLHYTLHTLHTAHSPLTASTSSPAPTSSGRACRARCGCWARGCRAAS